MAEPPDPLKQFADDVVTTGRSRLLDAKWWMGKFAGHGLTWLLGGGVLTAGLLWAAFPFAVGGLTTVVILGLAIYAIYCRKQLIDERAMRRRAWIATKTLQKDVRQRELAIAEAALVLVGHPEDRSIAFRMRGPFSRDLHAAVRYAEARQRFVATQAKHPTPARAARRAPAAPVVPDLAALRRRREVQQAELKKLEAEIQALAVPDAVDAARAAEEARDALAAARSAAHEADRVARDRLRRGRTPHQALAPVANEPRPSVTGEPHVRRPSPRPTPESVAHREDPASSPESP